MKKKAAPPLSPTPNARLIASWKSVGEKAVASRYASLKPVFDKPGTWEALNAAVEAGSFPLAGAWYLGATVCDQLQPRFASGLLAALPEGCDSLLYNYSVASVLAARALRLDPHALDALVDSPREMIRKVVELCHAEAGIRADGASPETRARLAREMCGGAALTLGLAVSGDAVTRVAFPAEARRAALTETCARVFGPTLSEDLAAAHREDLAAHTAAAGDRNVHPLYPSEDLLPIAARAMTPEEVCGFQMQLDTLRVVSARWSTDDMLRAAEATRARNRPDAEMIVNSLAVLAIERDPGCAPRAEPFINLYDLTNLASPTEVVVFEAMRKTDPAWLRRYVCDVIFARGASRSVFDGPLAIALLADIDPDAAERLAAKHERDLDFSRINGVDPDALLARIEKAGPTVRGGLALPMFEGYARRGGALPESADAHFEFDGSYRDAWIEPYLRVLPQERAVAIVRRELAAGRARFARAALRRTAEGEALLDEAARA